MILLAGFLFAAPLDAAPAADKGDDAADPMTRVQKLNRYAMQLFDDGNLPLAEKTLLEALQIVDKSNLGNSPAGLATNGNLAVLYSVGLKNPDKAVAHFKKALAVKPDLRMSKQRATAETEANLARAKAEMGLASAPPQPAAPVAPPPAKEPPPSAEPKHGEPVSGLKCPSEGEAQAGEDFAVECFTSADLKATEVTLFYKPNGGDQFQKLPMTKVASADGTSTWASKIPGSDTKAKWIPIYVEAYDHRGKTVAQSGREASPNVITVQGGEAAVAETRASASPEGDDEEEEEEEEGEEIDDDNPLARLEKERYREHQGLKGTWMFSFGVGSGFGYAGGKSTEAFGKFKVGFNPGLAWAYIGQVAPEISYFIGRSTAISVAGRNQWVPGGPKGTATGAHTLLVRLLFFSEGEDKLKWYFAPAAGWGEGFRFRVQAQTLDNAGNPLSTVQDTVRGGPFVGGIGTGMVMKLNRRWRWTLDSQFLLGFPNISGVVDLTTGLRFFY